jgi:hypothetical protein
MAIPCLSQAVNTVASEPMVACRSRHKTETATSTSTNRRSCATIKFPPCSGSHSSARTVSFPLTLPQKLANPIAASIMYTQHTDSKSKCVSAPPDVLQTLAPLQSAVCLHNMHTSSTSHPTRPPIRLQACNPHPVGRAGCWHKWQHQQGYLT